jgi:hypothetical protein
LPTTEEPASFVDRSCAEDALVRINADKSLHGTSSENGAEQQAYLGRGGVPTLL